MILHLGVIDIPYTNTADKIRIDNSRPRVSRSTTTGDVAEILEDKYHVMENFKDLHMPEIVTAMEDSLAGMLENLMMGAPVQPDAFGTACGKIEQLFKYKYLDNEEIAQTGQAGVPTAAALKGVNHRFKLKRSGRRQSFIDTGEYQASMKVWVE